MSTHIYDRIVAGRVHTIERDAARTMFLVARNALDTEAIHVAYQYYENSVAYLAIPASAAASGLLATQLVAALPGHPNHLGDGVYVLPLASTTVAVVCWKNRFEIYHHEQAAIDHVFQELGPDVPQFDVTDLPYGEMVPALTWARQSARHTLAAVSMVNMAAASGVAVLVTMAVVANVYFTTETKRRTMDTTRQLQGVVMEILGQTRLNDQLQELTTLAATATRGGGWIREYEFKNGASRFVVVMPPWITPDYVRQMGPDVVAEQDIVKGVIEFTKGASAGTGAGTAAGAGPSASAGGTPVSAKPVLSDVDIAQQQLKADDEAAKALTNASKGLQGLVP